jgi:hypothetical protein
MSTVRIEVAMIVTGLLAVGFAAAQSPIFDLITNGVIQKYQSSTCEQQWEARGKPKTPQQEEGLEMLRADPQLRVTFIDRIAALLANKMFECGMIPRA